MNSTGFQVRGDPMGDEVCIQDFCYISEFISVTEMLDTWFVGQNLTNIGGVIGLGYDFGMGGGGLWTNSSVNQNLEFAVKLRPSTEDWAWDPDAPMIIDPENYLYLGGPNTALLRGVQLSDYADQVSIMTSTSKYEWKFQLNRIVFADADLDQIKAYNTLKNYGLILSTGFDGLGLPSDMFDIVVGIIMQNYQVELTCSKQIGSTCYSEQPCLAVKQNLTNLAFTFDFAQISYMVYTVPIEAFMRQ